MLAYSTDPESDAQSLADAVEEMVTSGRTVVGDRPWSELSWATRTSGPMARW